MGECDGYALVRVGVGVSVECARGGYGRGCGREWRECGCTCACGCVVSKAAFPFALCAGRLAAGGCSRARACAL